MRLLVTRPQHQVAATIEALKTDGHDCIVSPMLQLHHLDLPRPGGNFDIIMLTSRNAVDGLVRQWHSFKDHGKRGDWTVFAVGDTTRDAAVRAGFVKAVSCNGSALDLVEMVAATCENGLSVEALDEHNILYPCALRPSHDFPALFEERGLCCAAWPVYAMEQAVAFLPKARDALVASKLDGVLLYSARSAENFAQLAGHLGDDVEIPPIFTLSDNICAALPTDLAAKCHPAAEPEEAALRLLLSQYKG
ncbi:MAG: uroporphyrinogen-III synthase [Rhizobiaceae bacterium]